MLVRNVPLSYGSYLKLKEKLERFNNAKDIMEIKRQRLSTEIESILERLKPIRQYVVDQIDKILKEFRIVYSHLGPYLVQAYAGSLHEQIEVKVSSINVVGVKVPFLKLQSLPDIPNQFPPLLRKTAKDLKKFIKDLFTITRMEVKIRILSEELKLVNRIANSLEERIIPRTKEKVSKIKKKLEQERIEAFTRKKMAREIIQKERKQRRAEGKQKPEDQSKDG